ncbi:hypothetical protein [Nostoc sp.]|uniref:hypothetical protein n=1 Tax=Nostoc sp. TaxID=1180 RepID=UPI002FF64076
MRIFKPKGQSLTPNQLLDFATIRQSDVDEMVRTSLPHEKLFINAVVKAGGRRQKAEGRRLKYQSCVGIQTSA